MPCKSRVLLVFEILQKVGSKELAGTSAEGGNLLLASGVCDCGFDVPHYIMLLGFREHCVI